MTALARPHHEPEENEAQIGMLLDALVDSLDDTLERAVRHGLEGRVREIISKHLPPPAAPRPATVSPADQPDSLQWAQLAALLRGFSKRRLTAQEHKALDASRLFVQAQMRRVQPEEGQQ